MKMKLTLEEDKMVNLLVLFLTKNSDEELLDRFNSLIENQVYKLNFKRF